MATTSTKTEETASADLSGVVERMRAVRAAQQAGVAVDGAVLAEIGGVEADAAPTPTPQHEYVPESVTFMASASDAMIAARPAEMLNPLMKQPPGATIRGWSAEVTARHPELVAAAMAEVAGAATAVAAAEDALDPNDPIALHMALAELGFSEVRKNNLRVRAIELNNDRLSAGIEAASNGSLAAQAAYAEAIEEAETAAEGATAAEAPAAATTTATPTTSPKTSSTGGSTSSSSS